MDFVGILLIGFGLLAMGYLVGWQAAKRKYKNRIDKE